MSKVPVLPLFIFDENILDDIPVDDHRLSFIHSTLCSIHEKLLIQGSSLLCFKGDPVKIWQELVERFGIKTVYINRDYEPYATDRDEQIKNVLSAKGINLKAYKDQVIFEPNEVLKNDGKPYTVYTPYKKRWLSLFDSKFNAHLPELDFTKFYNAQFKFPSLKEIGFEQSSKTVKTIEFNHLDEYEVLRDFPNKHTSQLGPHLRFGTISIRRIVSQFADNEIFLSELIWREFFVQILFHFPFVIQKSFKSKYDNIKWRNNKDEFDAWCSGRTGYPMVDAGMRELNETGYMHNRVRMITASFLCKHLLIDWRWGEAYFAQKLMDFELSSNNGNWQWAAGTGCDSAPYFRIFNPSSQTEKFDPELKYIKKWISELGTAEYPPPMVDHRFARQRALDTYHHGLH